MAIEKGLPPQGLPMLETSIPYYPLPTPTPALERTF